MEYIDYIVKAFIGLMCAGVFGACVEYVKRSIIKQRAIEKEIKALAHDALFRFCREIMAQSYITEYQLENLEHLYGGYSGLGMNGTGKKLYEFCKELPIKEGRIS